MCRIVHVLGMPSATLLDRVKVDVRNKFFERIELNSGVIPSSDCDTNFIAETIDRTAYYILKKPSNRDLPRPRTLAQILGVYTGGPGIHLLTHLLSYLLTLLLTYLLTYLLTHLFTYLFHYPI